MEEPLLRDAGGCPVWRRPSGSRPACSGRKSWTGTRTCAGIVAGPAAELRVTVARCDHLALIAVSRNVRALGLDVERVREDIPFEEMAGGFLDPRSQWDLRITRSHARKGMEIFSILDEQ